jgi:hypothetical protein
VHPAEEAMTPERLAELKRMDSTSQLLQCEIDELFTAASESIELREHADAMEDELDCIYSFHDPDTKGYTNARRVVAEYRALKENP